LLTTYMRALSSAICHFAVRNTRNTRCLKKVTDRLAFELSTATARGRPAEGTTILVGDWTGVCALAGAATASETSPADAAARHHMRRPYSAVAVQCGDTMARQRR